MFRPTKGLPIQVLKTWHATYPRIGVPEAVAIVADLGDASFLVAVAVTGRADDGGHTALPVNRLHGTVAEAQARADVLVIRLLGREVIGKWRGPIDGEKPRN
jgi:hypothetical protein